MPTEGKKSAKDDSKPVAFVISPIGDPDSPERKRADQILKHVIKPVASELGYGVVRADKISKPGIITSQILEHIMNDALVIADLTDHNPNVFYELAVRHTIKKPVIQVIREGQKIPFDVAPTRTIPIDHKDLDSVEEAKKELMNQIKAVEEDPSLVDSPISVAVDLHSLKESDDPTRKTLAELRTYLQGISVTMGDIRNRIALKEMHGTRILPVSTGKSYVPFDIVFPTSPEAQKRFIERAKEEVRKHLERLESEEAATKRRKKKTKKKN